MSDTNAARPEAFQETVPANSDIGTSFLLADFNSIRAFKEQSVSIGNKRVDLLIALTTALAGGLGLLSQTNVDARALIFIALFGSLGLLAVGLVIFYQVIDRDILIVDYIRAINRIRAYFAEHAPYIRPFLLMPTSHEFPSYDWQSSNRRIPMVINGMLLGAACVLLRLLRDPFSMDFLSVVLAILAFLAAYGSQEAYARRFFQRADFKARASQTVSLYDSQQRFAVASKPSTALHTPEDARTQNGIQDGDSKIDYLSDKS